MLIRTQGGELLNLALCSRIHVETSRRGEGPDAELIHAAVYVKYLPSGANCSHGKYTAGFYDTVEQAQSEVDLIGYYFEEGKRLYKMTSREEKRKK